MSTYNIPFKLTAVGIDEAFNLGAVNLAVTHVQIGSGNKSPNGNEVALVAPQEYAAISGHFEVSAGQHRIAAVIAGSAASYNISEIGLWSGVPGDVGSVLVFYWALAAGNVAVKSASIDFNFENDMFFGGVVPANITIVADTEFNALAMLAAHEAATDPHAGYLKESDIVSQAEAETGTATTVRAWAALRVRQAINAVVALYAPLASPALTGNPTAPTAAQFDNDASIATTAFVQRALGSYAGIKAVNVPYTLIASDAGKLIIASGNGAVTFPSGIFPAGAGVVISASTNGDNINVSPPAGGVFSYGGAQVASISLKDDENVSLISQGLGSIIPVVNAGGLRSSPDFLFQLGVSGHFKHPSGAIYQWGTVAVTAAGDAAVTLPKFLPTALRAMGGNIISSSVGYAVSVNMPTQAGFNIGVYTNATTRGAANVMWWAIGE